MAEPKTKVTDVNAEDFISGVDDETRRNDSFELLKIYKRVTGLEPKMWGPSIVGYGSYLIKPGTAQQAEWPLAAFSPRKQNLTLYVYPNRHPELLKNLGKHSTSVACLYIKKLADIDLSVLEKIIAASYKQDKEKYEAQNS